MISILFGLYVFCPDNFNNKLCTPESVTPSSPKIVFVKGGGDPTNPKLIIFTKKTFFGLLEEMFSGCPLFPVFGHFKDKSCLYKATPLFTVVLINIRQGDVEVNQNAIHQTNLTTKVIHICHGSA